MISLDQDGTRALSLITGQNGADVIVAFSDYTPATGAYARKAPTCTTIASATTTSICATPGTASDIRDIDFLSIKNTYAGAHAMTLQITSGAGGPFVLANVTLLQNETLQYIHGTGLVALDVNGNRKEVTASNFTNITASGTLAVTGNFTGSGEIFASGASAIIKSNTNSIYSKLGVATPAGGTPAFVMGSANISISWGSGVPTMSAARGSIYLRTDGAANSAIYYNTNGSTGWGAIATV